MITINDLNKFILIITLILMSYYVLSSLGINISDLFTMSQCNNLDYETNEPFMNVNHNKNSYKKIENYPKIEIDYQAEKKIENFEEEHLVRGTNLLLFPLIEKVYNQNGVANVNRNQSKDLRGDVYTNYSSEYTPFYSN